MRVTMYVLDCAKHAQLDTQNVRACALPTVLRVLANWFEANRRKVYRPSHRLGVVLSRYRPRKTRARITCFRDKFARLYL